MGRGLVTRIDLMGSKTKRPSDGAFWVGVVLLVWTMLGFYFVPSKPIDAKAITSELCCVSVPVARRP